MAWRNLTILQKFSTVLLVCAIALLANLYSSSVRLEETVVTEREETLQSLAEAASAVVNHYYQIAERGELSVDEAQHAALEAIRAMRFDDGNYLFVCDQQFTVIAHGFNRQREGESLLQSPDANGVYYGKEFQRLIRSQGQGFVTYQQIDPRTKKVNDKLSYVLEFKPWHWTIGNGVMLSDIDTLIRAEVVKAGMVCLIALVIVFWLIIGLSRDTRHRVAEMVTQLKHAEQGELDHPSDESGKDEFSEIARQLNATFAELRTLITSVKETTVFMDGSCQRLVEQAEQTRAGVAMQFQDVGQATTAIEEMGASTREFTSSTERAKEISQQADETAREGLAQVQSTCAVFADIAEHTGHSAVAVASLQEDVQAIGNIVNVINDISDQTNLLALNAAIEAARAGEMGRGFAVVADEVRNLAQRTQQSTSEIQTMIDRLQSRAQEVSTTMQEGREQIDSSNAAAQGMVTLFDDIARQMDTLSDMSHQLAASTEQQAVVSSQIEQSMISIREQAETSSEATNNTVSVVDELKGASAQVSQLISRFNV